LQPTPDSSLPLETTGVTDIAAEETTPSKPKIIIVTTKKNQ